MTSKQSGSITRRGSLNLRRVYARSFRGEKSASRCSWHKASARCAGRSHLLQGIPCQDNVATLSKNGITVLALADGAGSSLLSHYGSSLIVSAACDYVCSCWPSAEFVADFAESMLDGFGNLLRESSRRGIDLTESERLERDLPKRVDLPLVPCDIRDLSCTVLVVALRGNDYFGFHVGDGVVGAQIERHGVSTLEVISGPTNGEFANETVFVTSKRAKEEARIFKGRVDAPGRKTTGFILMSDGPEASLFDKRNYELSNACSKLFEASRKFDEDSMDEALEETLVNVVSKRTNDDCSIALMARVSR